MRSARTQFAAGKSRRPTRCGERGPMWASAPTDLCRDGAHDVSPYRAVAAIIDRHAFGTNAICRRQIPMTDRLCKIALRAIVRLRRTGRAMLVPTCVFKSDRRGWRPPKRSESFRGRPARIPPYPACSGAQCAPQPTRQNAKCKMQSAKCKVQNAKLWYPFGIK